MVCLNGGLEKNAQEVTNLPSRADLVLFPIDCVSFQYYWHVKKSYKKQQKSCKPLQLTEVSSLMDELSKTEQTYMLLNFAPDHK